MGIRPVDYYRMTYREFFNSVNGYQKKIIKEYDHTRHICWTIAAVNRDPKKPMQPVKKFWPLPTDEEKEDNYDDLKQRLERARQSLLNRKNGNRS